MVLSPLRPLVRIAGRLLLALTLAPAFAAASPAPTDEAPVVTLPLAEYLAMVAQAEDREKANAASAKAREASIAEVVEERIAARLENQEAKLTSFFEVLVQGTPIKPIWLPLAGYGATVQIEKLDVRGQWVAAPAASLTAFGGREGGVIFVSTERGRFRISAESRLALPQSGGQLAVRLLKVAAPVASAEFDLPAELEWTSPGAVVVGEVVSGGRRQVRLATQRGNVPLLEARRRYDQGEEKPLAHTVVLTLVQLRPEGLRRHDVLLYEVSRGSLSAFEVTLPAGLEIEQAATDEGPVVPLADGRQLRIERRRQLQGTGYLVISSRPADQGELALPLLEPAVEVRARFLAVASSLAAEIGPRPAASFSQVDLSDLPPLLGQALGAVDLAAAWRLGDGAAAAALALQIAPLPAASTVATTVVRRDTTTLLTVDGTLLHREVFELAAADRPASSFEVALPAGATLWSTKVDEQPTRPLQRAGKVVLPILPKQGQNTRIEVVAVLEQAIAPGRSQLEIELAQVLAPVLQHNWRLLLPDSGKYRFSSGELQPVPAQVVYLATPAFRRDQGIVGGVPGGAPGGTAFGADREEDALAPIVPPMEIEEVAKQRADKPARGKKVEAEAAAEAKEGRLAAANYNLQVGELQQGLVGGVKPLPITIPESGKALVLTGVLPPARVSVTIDVKAGKK